MSETPETKNSNISLPAALIAGAMSLLCVVGIDKSAGETTGPVLNIFLCFTIIGIIMFRRGSRMSKMIMADTQMRIIDLVIISMLTFGSVGTSAFVYINKQFPRSAVYTTDGPITAKVLNAQKGYNEHGEAYKMYSVSYTALNRVLSIDVHEVYHAEVEAASYVHVTYRKGLFGFWVITDAKVKP